MPCLSVQESRQLSSCREVDWSVWEAQIRATLVFIIRGDEVLLMRKKRGIGAGKINAPGGKIDPGESAAECAVREAMEEVHVRALDPVWRGLLQFQFLDGLSIHCQVFSATQCTGTPTETDEGDPFWCPLDAIPYHDMWEDDSHWLPAMLKGQNFDGRFIFDDEAIVDMDLRTWPQTDGQEPMVREG